MTKLLIFCLFFCLLPTNIVAQKKHHSPSTFPKDSLIQRLFAPATPLKWVKKYAGRMDDVSDIELNLGFDGKNCKGFLTYLESNAKLQLVGVFNEKSGLNLVEIDANRDTSGYIKGKIEDKMLHADWNNYNNSIGSIIACEEISETKLGRSHCGDNKWINKYNVNYNGGNFEIILCRFNNGILFGNSWMETGNINYDLKGEITENGDFFINLYKSDGSEAGSFQGNMQSIQSLNLDWATKLGKHQYLVFPLVETLSVGCYEFADYTNSYDVLYPKTRCNTCNTWMERKVTTWLNRCKGSFASNPQKQNPKNRAAQRASGWVDISLWNEDLFCGTMTFTESWADEPNGVAFNFDLNTGKEIKVEDLFIKNFDAKNWLENYRLKEVLKLPQLKETDFKNWIEQEGFPLFMLQREGIVLATPFHPVFGQQKITIPYSVLKPYLKVENPVAVFVK
jgi:hypothetical protein